MTIRRLLVRRDPESEDRFYAFRFEVPVPLRAHDGGQSGLYFSLRHVVSLQPTLVGARGGWQVASRMYEYRLLDRDERELLVYHWQPGSEYSGPDQPHLHISASLEAQVDAQTRRSIDLDKLHVVTGHVALHDFVRMLITEFQIKPLRPDWEARLAAPPSH